MATYPGTVEAFVALSGTSKLSSPDHTAQHTLERDNIVAIENVLGTTSGTSVIKHLSLGKFAAPTAGGTLTTTTISSGTISGVLLGTSTITGGTISAASMTSGTLSGVLLGTSTVTGGTITSAVINSPTGDVVTLTGTQTVTNKRWTKKVISATSYTTDTGTALNCDNCTDFVVTAQAGALKFNNPGGTPTDQQTLWIAVAATTARALTYDTQYEASGAVALPTTTVGSARLDMGFVWRADTSKWRIVASS